MADKKLTICTFCNGEGWVCENHPETPSSEMGASCCGGAATPCKKCTAGKLMMQMYRDLYFSRCN